MGEYTIWRKKSNHVIFRILTKVNHKVEKKKSKNQFYKAKTFVMLPYFGLRKICPYCEQASPTVGVYTMGINRSMSSSNILQKSFSFLSWMPIMQMYLERRRGTGEHKRIHLLMYFYSGCGSIFMIQSSIFPS